MLNKFKTYDSTLERKWIITMKNVEDRYNAFKTIEGFTPDLYEKTEVSNLFVRANIKVTDDNLDSVHFENNMATKVADTYSEYERLYPANNYEFGDVERKLR